MIRYTILGFFCLHFCFLFHFNAQSSLNIKENVSYTSSSNIGDAKELIFQPKRGYFDQAKSSPFFQLSIGNSADYVLREFTFEEELLDSLNYSFCVNGEKNKEYEISFRNIESNAKYRKSLLLINCIRFHKGDYYRVTKFSLSLDKSPLSTSNFFRKTGFASQSFFADGSSWYKFRNYKSGLYKLDYNFLLNNGIITGDVSSNAIHLFANNKGLLSGTNDDNRPDDIIQQSLYIYDGGDGLFSMGDYMLFYLDNSDKISWDGVNFSHLKNMYSDSAYLFLNINNNRSPNKLDSVNHLAQNFTEEYSSFRDFYYFEEDEVNLLKSGSQWFGDIFDLTNNYSYSIPFTHFGDSSQIKLKLVSKSYYSTAYFNMTVFGQTQSIPITSSGSTYYSPVGKVSVQEYNIINDPSQGYVVDLQYDNNGVPSSKGYLDFIEVNCNRELKVDEQQFDFYLSPSGGVSSWSKVNLTNANSVQMIWDITDLSSVNKVEFQRNGSDIYFISNVDTLKRFVAISGDNFQSPDFIKRVNFQNLHAFDTPDMVIVTPAEFKQSAEELMLIHQEEGLDVITVTDEEIYNEFSGGAADASAIKQFLRMFYVRENANPNSIPKYCLLFGDGTYDNRNLLGHNKNFLPVYESYESLSVTNTYVSDDFYAILSDGASMQNTDQLNIAVGRLTISNAQQAAENVEKIRNYLAKNEMQSTNIQCSGNTSESILGDWRNKVVLVSDDEDNSAYFTDIEIMSSKIEQNKPTSNIIKVHADAYAQQSSPVGERIPAAADAIDQKVNDGALVVNYIGHGGETGWAHEQILTVPTIQNWSNSLNMPIFMTATCEFGRFDDHDRVSAGEYVLLNPNGGGIGLFTTTRLVYATPNEWLNRYFYDTVFDLVDFKAQRLGDIYQGTKNKFAQLSADPNYRKFALIGDPAIKLALPEYKVEVDSFNRDTVNALSEVVLYGHLSDNLNNQLTGFNGKIFITFFDKKSSFSTLGTNSGSSVLPFQMWKNIIYKGKSSVNNGVFEFTFKVPKDIGYNYGLSRMSFYAENGEIDASGYNGSLVIGGIDTNAEIDEIGPDMDLFLNDENFISGGISDNEPLLIVGVFDENGINTVGNGIGHDIELVIDDDFANSVVLNDYYEADLDTYKSGRINYQLTSLEPGDHKLKVKIWDNYNNSSEKELSFTVIDEKDMEINHVLNYPNPFTTQTSFYFEHNQNCDFLDVSIQIYTVTGKVVNRINRRIHNEGFRSEGIIWDGRDEFGEKLSKGVYVYNLKVTNEQGLSSDKTETMFLLK